MKPADSIILKTPKSRLTDSDGFGVFHGISLLGVIAGAFALIALARMALAAGSNLDAVQTAAAVFSVVLAAGYIAQDALVLVGNCHTVHLPC